MVRMRITEDHGAHKKDERVDMTSEEVTKAVREGWATPDVPGVNPANERETRDDVLATEAEKPRRKVAIIGTAEPHWRAAPFHDKSWEIWTCGGVFQSAPRTDRHFEIHAKSETCKGWGGSAQQEAEARATYWAWLAERGPAAVLQKSTNDAPNASVYPLESVLEAFSDGYFTNSISYMIALALLEGVDEIGLWGIDMALSGDGLADEYGLQRPSVEFYLGIACGRGITVHLPPETTLLKARKLYGFQGPQDDGFNQAAKAKIDELEHKAAQISQFIAKHEAELNKARADLAGVRVGAEVAGYFKRNMEH